MMSNSSIDSQITQTFAQLAWKIHENGSCSNGLRNHKTHTIHTQIMFVQIQLAQMSMQSMGPKMIVQIKYRKVLIKWVSFPF